jgi:hypothetical protein
VVDEHVAAGRERVDQCPDELGGAFGVEDVVDDAAQQQPDRLVPVQLRADCGIADDARGVEQVTAHDERAVVVGEQRAGVRQHHGVVVQVHDAGRRVDPLGDLVDVVRGGQARADIKQLRDADLADQVAHHPAEHGALRLHAGLNLRERGDDLVAERAVGGEIVLTAEQIVVDPRHVRTGRVKPPGGTLTSCHQRIVLINRACVRRPSG